MFGGQETGALIVDADQVAMMAACVLRPAVQEDGWDPGCLQRCRHLAINFVGARRHLDGRKEDSGNAALDALLTELKGLSFKIAAESVRMRPQERVSGGLRSISDALADRFE